MTAGQVKHRIELGDPRAPDVAVLLAAAADHARSLYPPDGIHMLDAGRLTAPSVRFWVARSAGGVAQGCGAFVADGAGAAELKQMWVAPAARNRGLGARLLRHLEDDARVAGVRVMRLETGPRQHAAIRLYQRFGYRDRGPFGAYRPDPWSLFMEKEL